MLAYKLRFVSKKDILDQHVLHQMGAAKVLTAKPRNTPDLFIIVDEERYKPSEDEPYIARCLAAHKIISDGFPQLVANAPRRSDEGFLAGRLTDLVRNQLVMDYAAENSFSPIPQLVERVWDQVRFLKSGGVPQIPAYTERQGELSRILLLSQVLLNGLLPKGLVQELDAEFARAFPKERAKAHELVKYISVYDYHTQDGFQKAVWAAAILLWGSHEPFHFIEAAPRARGDARQEQK